MLIELHTDEFLYTEKIQAEKIAAFLFISRLCERHTSIRFCPGSDEDISFGIIYIDKWGVTVATTNVEYKCLSIGSFAMRSVSGQSTED